MKREIPQLVQEFEQQQQQQQVAPLQQQPSDVAEGAPYMGLAQSENHGDAELLRQQMAALEQMIREQSRELQQLRASPGASPQLAPSAPSVQPFPLPAPSARAAASEVSSRFAKKEPRASDLREYDGASGPKLEEWLLELERAVRLFHLNDREAIEFGMSRLCGAALQWSLALDSTQQTALTDVKAFASALRARFQPVTAARSAREQLRGLRQGGRPVNDYISDFQRLVALVPGMNEEEALFAFESGLQPTIALELRKQACAKLADGIALAARVGGILTSASSSSAAPHPSRAHQMEMYDERDERLNRIEHALLAIGQQQQDNRGLGAKTQTQRGYQQQRGPDRGGRGGRGGSFRGGAGRSLPQIPGVPGEIVAQRYADRQCLRCGDPNHRGVECPNSISSASSVQSSN